jgi:Fe2+ or Zn2+ uptake regulation protein
MVWDALHQHGPYLTAEEIFQLIQSQTPDFNRTTIYRVLASLRDVGLVQELQAGKGPCRYAASVDYHGGPQIVCMTCGSVVEIEDLGLSQQIGKLAESNGFEAGDGVDVVVFATCTPCAKLASSAANGLAVQKSG